MKPSTIFGAVLLLTALLLGLLGYGYSRLMAWSETPILVGEAIKVELKPGTGLSHFAQDLQAHEVVTSAHLFSFLVRLERQYPRFQAGTYRFDGAITPHQIIEDVANGRVFREVVLDIQVPEGFTVTQIASRLDSEGIDVQAMFELAADPAFIRSLKIEGKSIEGYLFPATYTFYDHKPELKDILHKMVEEFFARLPHGYRDQVAAHHLTLDEAVIFASLIERETARNEERGLISEVIWNRLKAKSPLAIDAALIYGIKDYDGNIRTKDLQDRTNPYNTRIIHGLPPTAIGAPSTDSLLAVLNPAHEGNFYYVLLPGGEGKHHFSKTLTEHNRFVQKLVRATKR